MRPAIGGDIPWDKAPQNAEQATVDAVGMCRFWLGTQGFARADKKLAWWAPSDDCLAQVQLDVCGGGEDDEIYKRPTPEPEDDLEQLKIDAARWRALIGSGRIRALGSAGLYMDTKHQKHSGYAHLGLELWTTNPEPLTKKMQGMLARERETGVLWLTAYVDIARGLPRLPRSKT
jgi:hypothetical protein